jgi:S1-C subfamily serine protease
VNLRSKIRILAACLAAVACYFTATVAGAAAGTPAEDARLAAAICPIVYALDQSSSNRGYHYIFYGNAFFIDNDGYLLTAAHVLSEFRDGGQPQILLRLPEAPPRLLKVEVVGVDSLHDVAILRAVPNPFAGKYKVAFLPLAAEKLVRGEAVVAAALRPSRLLDPHTFDEPRQERAPGEVLEYLSTPLEKGAGKSELFLFSHEVLRGQSGAPVVSGNLQQVVGIVEGRWLHPGPATGTGDLLRRAPTMGAAVPISYAIALLEEKQVVWHSALQSNQENIVPSK